MKRTAFLSAAFLSAALLAGALPASAEDVLDGVYVEGCLPEVTCSAEIVPTGAGRWAFEWIATDRLGRETYCRHSAELALGRSVTTDGTELENVPTGILRGTKTKVTVLDLDGGQIHVGTQDGEDPCPKVPSVKGLIGMNGIYDLEGDV